MHWVYVIACEDDVLYVGETTQLVTRLRAHFKGQGSVCTRTHKPLYVTGLYRVGRHASYRDGCDIHLQKPADKPNALWLEQRFVEEMRRVCSAKVVGGSFPSTQKQYKPLASSADESVVFCDCNVPCEIVKEEDVFVHVCAARNVTWLKRMHHVPVRNTHCDFRKSLTADIETSVCMTDWLRSFVCCTNAPLVV